MATTIITKYGSGAPTASDVVRGELAVDTENGRLYTEDSGGSVIEIGLNPSGNVDVTGTVTADGLTVDGSTTGSVAILVENTLASGDADSDINLKTASSGGELRINFDHPSATSPSFIQGDDRLNFAPNGTVAMSLENNGDISFYEDTGTTAKLFWDASAESLGIGTSSPATLLNTKGATLTTTTDKREILIEAHGDGVNNSKGALTGITFRNSPLTYTAGSFNRTSGVYGLNEDSAGYGRSMGLAFYTATNDATATEAMRIDSDGSILKVSGSNATLPAISASLIEGEVRGSEDAITTIDSGLLRLSAGGGTTVGVKAGIDIFRGATDGSLIRMFTNGSEALRIDSSGNVGIGVSSLVTGSTRRVLQVSTGTDGGQIAFADSTTEAANPRIFATNKSDLKLASANSGASTIQFITGTTSPAERMRIDSSGNVGIGLTNPSSYYAENLVVAAADEGGITIECGSTEKAYLMFARGTSGSDAYRSYIGYDHGIDSMNIVSSGYINFYTDDPQTEKMRLTAGGDLLVNTTSAAAGAGFTTIFAVNGASTDTSIFKSSGGATSTYPLRSWNDATSGDNAFIAFATENSYTQRATIDYNRGANLVRYNTSSDATLKNIIGDSDGQKSIEILNTTRIREFAWKDDPAQKVHVGVIAQELHETYKGAVSVGGEVQKTDEDGNSVTHYQPWGVDKTAFTFHLVAGWQAHQKIIEELKSEIETLKSEVAALKGAN